MKIIRALHLGMCFGVRDAIKLATGTAAQRPITVLGELVHNPAVLESLRARGIRLNDQLDDVTTRTVMITAHGASDRLKSAVRARGHDLLEATCPLVHFAHNALRKLVREGCHPVVIGKRGHVEVRGLTEDYPECDIVLTEEEIERLQERPRFGVVAQTTQPVERVRRLVERLRERFTQSEVRFTDTVCQPTRQRQQAAAELGTRCDIVIVIGGANSNNTRELVETCRRARARVHHVQSADDLRPEWFTPQDVVGVTAGTSTPDAVIDAVEAALDAIASEFEVVGQT